MPSRTEAERVSQLVFYGTVFLIAWLAWRIVQPFLVEIAWAVVLAICLDPIRVRLLPRLGPTRTALALTWPSWSSSSSRWCSWAPRWWPRAGPRSLSRGPASDEGGAADWFRRGWEWLRAQAPFLPTEQEAIARVTASVGKVAEFLAGQAGGILKGAANFLFSLVITLGVLFFMVRDGASFQGAIRRVLPFGGEQNDRLLALTSDLVSASVTATLAIAALQGLIGGVTFALLGIDGWVLWGAIMGILSLLPLVGATLVWLPAAVWLALSGSLVKGIVLAAVGVLVLGNVDNVVRPLLLSGKSKMNTLVLIISLMGGVSAFGFIGIVIGPLVAALVTALVESYHAAPEPAPAPAVEPPVAASPGAPPVGEARAEAEAKARRRRGGGDGGGRAEAKAKAKARRRRRSLLLPGKSRPLSQHQTPTPPLSPLTPPPPPLPPPPLPFSSPLSPLPLLPPSLSPSPPPPPPLSLLPPSPLPPPLSSPPSSSPPSPLSLLLLPPPLLSPPTCLCLLSPPSPLFPLSSSPPSPPPPSLVARGLGRPLHGWLDHEAGREARPEASKA